MEKDKRKLEIDIQNLYITIDNENLISDVSLKVYENEIVGILGESGSGKTLTTKFILNILPNRAIINYKKKYISNKLGVVFQNAFTMLNPTMKISTQLKDMYKSHYSNLKGYNEKIEKLFNNVGLNYNDFKKKYPFETSGGQRQRISIALALISNPKVFIADEITTALDEKTKKDILSLLKNISKNCSILFITHDIQILKEFSDRIYVMYNGRIVEQNSSFNIFNNPEHEYTKQLIELSKRRN